MKIPANSADKVEVKERELIPEGTYLCRVLEIYVKNSEKSGEYWTLKLEIQGGPYDGKFVFDSLFFTPKSLNRFFLVWKRLTGFELDQTADLDVNPDDLLGCKADVTVIHREETYKGETTMRVRIPYDGYNKSIHPGGNGVQKASIGPKMEDDLPNF